MSDGDGHDYELGNLPRWHESMGTPYSPLGESTYEPALHDAAVNRYVRGEEFYTPAYNSRPVTDANNFSGQPLRNQTAPDG